MQDNDHVVSAKGIFEPPKVNNQVVKMRLIFMGGSYNLIIPSGMSKPPVGKPVSVQAYAKAEGHPMGDFTVFSCRPYEFKCVNKES